MKSICLSLLALSLFVASSAEGQAGGECDPVAIFYGEPICRERVAPPARVLAMWRARAGEKEVEKRINDYMYTLD